MLTDSEIKEIEKLSQKNPVVGKLFDFYTVANEDGLEALRISLNKKLIEVSQTIGAANVDDNDDKTFERIDRIVASLKKISKGEKKTDKVEEGSFTDRKADKNRI